MIFWVLLGSAIVFVIFAFIVGWNDWAGGFWLALGFGFMAACVSALVGGGLLALSLLIPGTVIRPEVYDLRAIGTSSQVSGRFYLGSGYINGERTLNYIKQEDGWSSVDSAVAHASRVFEDSAKPTVIEYTHVYSNGLVIPWEFDIAYSWDFHIPEGSILEDYAITNE